MFRDYSINFLNLVVLQCYARTGVLKNPEGNEQALPKETLFIFGIFLLISKLFSKTLEDAALQVYLRKIDCYPK